MNMKEQNVQKIGWFASITAILMFSAYIDQIILNVNGQTGSIILPIATTINCIAWVSYAVLKEQKDWPIFICNLLGALVGVVTTATGVIYS